MAKDNPSKMIYHLKWFLREELYQSVQYQTVYTTARRCFSMANFVFLGVCGDYIDYIDNYMTIPKERENIDVRCSVRLQPFNRLSGRPFVSQSKCISLYF